MSKPGSGDGRLYEVYLMEAVRLTEDIRDGIDRLQQYWARHKELHAGKEESTLVVDPKVQKDLQTVISDIARLSNLLSYESRSKRCPYIDASRQRTQYFRGLLGSVPLEAISSRAARNSLEHFEERIDEEILRQRRKRPNSPGLIYGCMLPNQAMLDLVAGDRTRIRVFVFDEMRYFNFEGEISLRRAREEVEAIRSALSQKLGQQGYKNAAAGSGVIYPGVPSGALTPESM
jgi:hypothetical protein